MTNSARKQVLFPRTGMKKRLVFILLILCLFLLAGGLWYYASHTHYTPPAFATDAIEGVPSPEEHFLYGEINCQFGYHCALAANLYQQEDSGVYIYFTNPSSNQVNLKCEIRKKGTNKLLYSSDVIRPGEYIEKLYPTGSIANQSQKVIVYVYAFEPDTWYSAGTTSLELTLQPW